MSHKSIYVCDNCGADIVFNLYESIKPCSYCGVISAIVNDDVYKNNFTNIMPFELSFEDALKEAKKIKSYFNYLNFDSCEYDKVFLPFSDIECDVICFAGCKEVAGDDTYYYDVYVDGHINNYFDLCIKDIDINSVVFSEYIVKK